MAWVNARNSAYIEFFCGRIGVVTPRKYEARQDEEKCDSSVAQLCWLKLDHTSTLKVIEEYT